MKQLIAQFQSEDRLSLLLYAGVREGEERSPLERFLRRLQSSHSTSAWRSKAVSIAVTTARVTIRLYEQPVASVKAAPHAQASCQPVEKTNRLT